ncbi:MAG: hypothetical protein KDD70_08390 [Bdellovibrionales bacterium]|nr:hypothetical protein [Bdellovibrionales bacterium]
MKKLHCEVGLALLSVLFLLTLMASLLGAYLMVAHTELAMVKSSRNSQSGFNAAEAGLNIRAEELRQVFLDYALPSGTSPSSVTDCDAGNLGSGDYACSTISLGNNHSATTYVEEDGDNPNTTVIPPGETFAGLSAIEYRYNVRSVGRNANGSNEAILDLTFQARKVPLFQFMIFFEEDLEVFNGAVMTMDGPVHTNGDMYIGTQTGGTTNYTGQVTIAGEMYRGLKSVSSCSGYTGTAKISDTPDRSAPNYLTLDACGSNRFEITDVEDWLGNIDLGIEPVTVPSPEDMDAFSDGEFWQRADLRLALRLDGGGNVVTTNSPTGVEVVNTAGVTDVALTNLLHSASCPGLIQEGVNSYVVGNRNSTDGAGERLRLYREYQIYPAINNYQQTLEVDMQGLLNCLHSQPNIMGGKSLSDETEDGLVFFFAIDGPAAASAQNNYSVRIRNGDSLQSSLGGAPDVEGLTVVTDQGLIIWGDYNSVAADWVPAALMADTTWLLSNDWDDIDSEEPDRYNRDGDETTVNAAVLSAIRRTGGVNGEAGQDFGEDSNGGGAINVFRFNEWFREGSAIPDFHYTGSMVSLGAPRKSQSTWGPFTYYSAPNRDWSFEDRFNDPENLPPMTPVFVYLRQELFVREYVID